MDVLPSAESLLTDYAAYMVYRTYEDLPLSEWQAFSWGAYNAVTASVYYPTTISPHSSGTVQQVILAAVDGNLLMITIYAPASDWTRVASIWQTILSGVVVNGEALPIEELLSALQAIPE
jgi:hypothetical protein